MCAAKDWREWVQHMEKEESIRQSEPQGSARLLPHQRSSPVNVSPSIRFSRPSSYETKSKPTALITRSNGVFVMPSKVFVRAGKPDSVYITPQDTQEAGFHEKKTQYLDLKSGNSPSQATDTDYKSLAKTGLAKSRWAGLVYDERQILSPGNQASRPDLELSALGKRSSSTDDTYPGRLSQLNRALSDERDDLDGVENRTRNLDLGYKGTVVQITQKASEAITRIDTMSTKINDEDTNEQQPTSDAPDPRGNWPTELYTPAGAYQNALSPEWAMRRDGDRFSDCQTEPLSEILSEEEVEEPVLPYMTEFIKSWSRNAHSVKADFLDHEADPHGDCDVNTDTGELIEPINFPRTRQQDLPSREQLEKTSALAMREIAAEILRRDPGKKAQRLAEKRARALTRALEAEAQAAVLTTEVAAIIAEETVTQNAHTIQIPCHLRPVVASDIKSITAIYNREIEEGYNVMDTKPVGRDDFCRIYDECLARNMPFMVAVEGWYDGKEEAGQNIIGFSLVTEVIQGIGGSFDTLSSPGGKMVAIVKPEYRRMRIGTALIDILMTNCTGWYNSKEGYQFVNLTHDWISTEFSGKSNRKWYYLEMDFIIKSGANKEATQKGEEFRWIQDFLELNFSMCLRDHNQKCCLSPQGHTWYDRLTFRRDCR